MKLMNIAGNIGDTSSQRSRIRRRLLRDRFALSAFTPRLLIIALALIAILAAPTRPAHAETCTTQSGLSDPERDGLADAAHTIALKIQSNDAAALRTSSVAEVQKDFGSLQYLVAVTAPKLTGATPTVDQVYVLDAVSLKRNADGSAPDAQFFCSLNRSTMEADFVIPSLPPGKYGFAIVNVAPLTTAPSAAAQAQPYRLSLLLRQEPPSPAPGSRWLLAGFYPKPVTAAGHDGLWYWTQARQFAKEKQPWNAWLYYQAATMLLRPADFVVSTHLDKLHTEQNSAAPPALSDGVSADAPLVVKAASGAEYHFTSLTIDDSLGQSSLDIAVHLRADPPPDTDPAAKPDAKNTKVAPPPDPRKRNIDAMSALLAAYPELRKPFHGISVYADTPGQPTVSTELAIADIK
jgi:hypothetical protein